MSHGHDSAYERRLVLLNQIAYSVFTGANVSTTEHLSEIVERVREATKSLSGDEFRLREIAFEKLLEHELATSTNGNSGAVRDPSSDPVEAAVDSSYSTPQMRADAVARYFDIDPEAVGGLFDLSAQAPALVLPANKIEHTKAASVRQIALLICGVRTALGIENGSAKIRDAAEQYDKIDQSFMATLTEFDKIAVRGKPSSQNRLIRMRVIGVEEAQAVARKLVSNGG